MTSTAPASETHTSNELLRKALHIGFGFLVILLRWLPWQAAAGVAAFAVLGNWLLLHHLVGKSVARHERGYDLGIVLYPFVVLVGIVVFHDRLEIAAAIWTMLAFGDGFAGLIGKYVGGRTLPWNPSKTWSGFASFVIAGTVGTYPFFVLLERKATALSPFFILFVVALASGIVESLKTNIDDNLTVPFTTAVTLVILAGPEMPRLFLGGGGLERPAIWWLVVNAIVAILGYLAKSVDLSGMISGFVLGAILIACAGWPLYIALLAFFIVGTLATKLGYSHKQRAGLAQEKGGRRGFSHAFSNVGVAAIIAIAVAFRASSAFDSVILLYFAIVASLATACADTVGSEIGQLLGRRTFLPLTFRSVPRGTEGAISLEGTLGGAVGALIVSWIGITAVFAPLDHPSGFFRALGLPFSDVPVRRGVLFVTACAIAGSYLESVIGSWNRKQVRPIPNGVLNFINTAVGAALVLLIAPFVRPYELLF